MAANPFILSQYLPQETFRGRGAQLGGIGTAIAQERARGEKEQQAQFRNAQMQEEFKGVMNSGDPKQVAAFSFKYPEAAKQAQQSFGIANPSTQGIATMGYGKALQTGNPEQAANQLDLYADQVEQAGGQPNNMRQDAEQLRNGTLDMNQLEMGVAMTEPKLWESYNEFNKSKVVEDEKKTKFQQGTGKLSGYVFNPDTGQYSVNSEIKNKLEKVKAEGVLDAKTRQSINKDFTMLTKDTKLIRNTAQDLEKLSKIKSGPASIAMVFKFMKALDPTSVVREGEFLTAENSSGVPEKIRNTYNKVMNGEKLGDKQMNEFVNTAKELANSAIDSSTTEVDSFIGTFEDTLPEGFKKGLRGRIPKRFDVKTNLSDADLLKKYGG